MQGWIPKEVYRMVHEGLDPQLQEGLGPKPCPSAQSFPSLVTGPNP